jgi:tetratricopeptide (TPR) repeat protein
MRKPIVAAAAIVLLLMISPAAAQTPDDCYKAGLEDDDQNLIRVCTRVLEKGGLTPSNLSTTLSNRGLGYLRSKQYDKAIIDFSEAILINPKNPFAFDNRGDAWREKGNYERALADYDEALSIEPTFTSALLNRGITYERQGDKVKARQDYEAALNQKGKRAIDGWARDQARERLERLGR